MVADTLNHPSTNAFQDRPLPPGDAVTRDELPALLRQSLLMWERIFAWQEAVRAQSAQSEPTGTSTTAPGQR